MEDNYTTEVSQPTITEAFRQGIQDAFKYWRVSLIYWLATLGLSMIVALPFRSTLLAETGNSMILNNLIAAASTATTRLALDWAAKQNLDEDAFLALLHTSSGQTWFGSNFGSIEFSRDGYAPDNSIGILKKDVESALEAAPAGADTALPQALHDAVAKLQTKG